MKDQKKDLGEERQGNEPIENETDIKADNSPQTDEKTVNTALNPDDKIKELNDKYLRLYSEFDNYRKRSLKERLELIKTASEDVFKAILPVIDDFERAMKANETNENVNSIKEGVQLIYNKLRNVTQQKGLTSFESIGQGFDPDIMEAITHTPAPEDALKGKVIDEVEKGYKLGDKVIRFAKVVVGQ